MKRIGFLPVGGTICTALGDAGELAVHSASAFWLTEAFARSDSPYAGEVEFVIGENLMLLSENMSVAHWNRIHQAYRDFPKEDCDGLIVAHGTDTLAYSAALFSQLWQDCPVPVIFVAANRPLSSPLSNGVKNFRAAVECLCLGLAPSVSVCYENPSDGVCYLHAASRLEQCRSYSEDFFSRGGLPLSPQLSQRAEQLASLGRSYPRRSPRIALPEGPLEPCVQLVFPYVGLRYDSLSLSGCRALLHLTYHSGTLCTEGNDETSVLHLLRRCAAARPPVDCYLLPAPAQGALYESLLPLRREAAPPVFLDDLTAECAYAKLLLAYSLLPPEQREPFLRENRNYEFFS